MQLSIRNVSFTYEGSYTPVFENLTINLDCCSKSTAIRA